MNCNDCNKVVSYYTHESDMARLERTIHRLWTIIIILIMALVCLCVGFFIYESQFEDVTTVTQENDSGYNNYVGNDGNIVNGDMSYGETDNN